MTLSDYINTPNLLPSRSPADPLLTAPLMRESKFKEGIYIFKQNNFPHLQWMTVVTVSRSNKAAIQQVRFKPGTVKVKTTEAYNHRHPKQNLFLEVRNLT